MKFKKLTTVSINMIQRLSLLLILIVIVGSFPAFAQFDGLSSILQDTGSYENSSSMAYTLNNEAVTEPEYTKINSSLIDTVNQTFFFNEEILGMHCVPLHGEVISKYGMRRGRRHTGTDIRLMTGDTVYAAFDGTVTRSSYYYGYGNMVVLQHGDGLETHYAHFSKCLVQESEKVMSGQPIGLGGRTGRATTAHLHFEIKVNGKYYDPELVFDFEGPYLASNTLHLRPPSVEHKKSGTDGPTCHIVARGDNLYDISRKYDTTVADICRINNISKSKVLRIGTQLKVK